MSRPRSRAAQPVALPARGSNASSCLRWHATSVLTTSSITSRGDELELLRNKSAASRLGFAVLLKLVLWRGRFTEAALRSGMLGQLVERRQDDSGSNRRDTR